MDNNPVKICGIATKFGTVSSFMLANLNYMAERGYASYCISNSDESISVDKLKSVTHIPADLQWGYVNPIKIIKQIKWFYSLFRKFDFDIIQYATFNAAFPASIAGWLAKVPVRINLQWGMSYAECTGFQHFFRRTVDKITCMCSTSVQPDSNSNLKLAIEDKLYPADKGFVVYNGSACGVDLERFNIEFRKEWRKKVFDKYNLSKYKRIFGYVGRVMVDKGINELLEAFLNIGRDDICLIFVGSMEYVDGLNQELYNRARLKDNIFFMGPKSNPEVYYAAFDYLLLPSYHEGFGMTVLESAAVGTPSIVTNIKGPTDFVVAGFNGLICDVKSVDSLQTVMVKAVLMPDEEYKRLADNAYQMVKRDFDSETFRLKFYENRESLLKKVRNV